MTTFREHTTAGHDEPVEVWIGEMARRPTKIHQREEELPGVLVHARAAPDDLLELGHRPDLAIKHDQAAGLRIDARGQQLGCRCKGFCWGWSAINQGGCFECGRGLWSTTVGALR